MWVRIFLPALMVLMMLNNAGAQTQKLFPVDEGPTEATFQIFRQQLLEAVQKRDKEFVLSILSPDIKNTFGGGLGVENFKEIWRLEEPDSPLWITLETILLMGGTFTKDRKRFISPYVFTNFPVDDPFFGYGAIVGNKVILRKQPGKQAPIITTLSYDIVKYLDFLNPIVFGTWRDGNEEVYSMAADGGNPQNLTRNRSQDGYPSCSPDGNKIAFASNRDGNWEIYVMNTDGSNQLNLTKNPADDGYPAWSPAWTPYGEKIAFASDRGGKRNIYIMDPNGDRVEKITDDPVEAVHPAWSPDGKKIYFASDRTGNRDIFVIYLNTRQIANITYSSAYDDYPATCLSNTKINIIYVSDRISKSPNRCDIYQIDVSQRPLIALNGDERHPTWSPFCSEVMFVSDKTGVTDRNQREIYIMNKDGTNMRRLTNNSCEDNHPKFLRQYSNTYWYQNQRVDQWVKVATLDGKTGYVEKRFVRSPIDYRAVFVKREGRWQMEALVRGD